MRLKHTFGALALCAALAACNDGNPTSPSFDSSITAFGSSSAGEVCQAITIDDLGLSHGDDITGSIYLSSLFPDPLSISLTRGDGDGAANQNPVAFNTAITPTLTEEDLQYDMSIGGECNTAVNGPRDASNGQNPVTGQDYGPGGFDDCSDSGFIMIVEDNTGFSNEGNDNEGGTFTLTGFPAGIVYLKSFEIVDNDDFEDPAFAQVDGSTVAVASSLGNGTVETVSASSTPLVNTSASFTVTASGGVDNLEFCKAVESPGTGTPGYWKNHPDAWPVDEITIGGETYTKAEAIAWLQTPVRGDKTVTMFYHLVSAKLNVLIGNADSCIAGTIDDADDWMATYGPVGSGVRASSSAWDEGGPLASTLDDYNNGLLCAPHRD